MAFRNFALLLRLGICALLLTGAPFCDATAAAQDDLRLKKILSDAAQLDEFATHHEAAVVDNMAQRYALLAGSPDAAKQLIVGLREGTILQQTNGQPVQKRLSYGTVYRVLVAATDYLRTRNISPPASQSELERALNSALASVLERERKAKSDATSSTKTSKDPKKDAGGPGSDQDKGSDEPSKGAAATPNPKDGGAKDPEDGTGSKGGSGEPGKIGSDPGKPGNGPKKGSGIAGDINTILGDCGGQPCGGTAGTVVNPKGIPNPIAITQGWSAAGTNPAAGSALPGVVTTVVPGGTDTPGANPVTPGANPVTPGANPVTPGANPVTSGGTRYTPPVFTNAPRDNAFTRIAPPVTNGTGFNRGSIGMDPKLNNRNLIPGNVFQKGARQ